MNNRAFALIDVRTNKCAIIDHRVPLYWMKRQAEEAAKKLNKDSKWLKVISVTIEYPQEQDDVRS